MELEDFKKEYVRKELKISEEYGRMLSILDFGNINHWFEEDRQDVSNKALAENEKFRIDLQGLRNFCSIFSTDVRFYYGTDSQKAGSLNFISAVKHIFGRNRVFSKQIQYVRHHLKSGEIASNTRTTFTDGEGAFVKIPKCNFDVEMSVDTIRLMETYDTLVMFSSDADFVALFRYLRKNGKRVVLIKGGNITSDLRSNTDLVVNAQNIKQHIATVEKQKPGV